MSEKQVEEILWCPDCMTKHSRDLLHHAEMKGDSELKILAEKAFDISSNMLEIKDKKLYSDIRDLEHHTEDLLTGLRTERKKIYSQNPSSDCPTCGNPLNRLKEKIYKDGSNNISYRNFKDQIEVKKNMVSTRDAGIIIGSQFAGKGVGILANYVDQTMAATGAPVLNRPSTWINIGGGLLAAIGGLVGLKNQPEIQLAAVVIGSNMLTKVVDYATELAAPAAVPSVAMAISPRIGELSGRYFQRQLAPQAFELNSRIPALKDIQVD